MYDPYLTGERRAQPDDDPTVAADARGERLADEATRTLRARREAKAVAGLGIPRVDEIRTHTREEVTDERRR